MKLNLTDAQKQILVSAVIALIIAVGALFGYNVKVTPLPTPTPEVQFGAESLSPIKFSNIRVDGTTALLGAVTDSSTLNVTGATTLGSTLGVAGVQANTNAVGIVAPTAVGTATPALLVDTAGVSNILSLRKNATPVFQVSGAGAVTGYVLQYGAARGQAQVCGSTNITSTTVIAHGLATPSYVNVSMAQDATGDGARVSFTNSAAVVTLKGWNSALTPAPNTTPIAVNWCVIGTP